MAEKECEDCGDKVEKKHMGKIRGKNLCKKCRIKIRLNHRKETLENSEDKETIKELDNKIKREYSRVRYNKLKGGVVRKYNPQIEEEQKKYIPKRYNKENYEPKIKGSIFGKEKQKNKSYSFLTLQEKQLALKTLMINKGLNFNEAKERMNELIEYQKKVRENMKEAGKSQDEIKLKQREILEELWRT